MPKDSKGHGSNAKGGSAPERGRGPGFIDYSKDKPYVKKANNSHFHASPGREERLKAMGIKVTSNRRQKTP